MGCDIHGWVEIKREGRWKQCVNVKSFLDRHYAFFGTFFGVRNYLEFDPLFDRRGQPSDLHYRTQGELDQDGSDAHSTTFFYVDELDKIDWKKEHEYEDDDGKKQKITLEQVVDGDEKKFFDLMKYLKTISEDVRCIVWFDN